VTAPLTLVKLDTLGQFPEVDQLSFLMSNVPREGDRVHLDEYNLHLTIVRVRWVFTKDGTSHAELVFR
jgi:hypothetical protein